MKYTNNNNIHQGLFAALAHDHYYDPSDKPSHYSATKLLSPIQQTALSLKYAKGLPQHDILDNYFSWLGSVLHEAVEKAVRNDKNSTAIVERRFYGTFYNKIISGKIDYLDGDTITDLKSCKTYKILVGDFSSWEKQANIYRLLAAKEGFTINNLQVEAMLLDWTSFEAKMSKAQGYPQTPIVTIPLKVWTLEETEQWIKQRVIWLEESKTLSDDELYKQMPCSTEEQWSKFTGTKLFKKGGKKATKVFKGAVEETAIEAAQYVADNEKYQTDEYYLEETYGSKTRCESYCDVKTKCRQYRAETIIRTGQDPHTKPLF
jgi:hypothetical protein